MVLHPVLHHGNWDSLQKIKHTAMANPGHPMLD